MGAYIIRRLLLMIPTVFGIMASSFLITQFAPGGPVEQALANLSGQNVSMTSRITGDAAGDFAAQPLTLPNPESARHDFAQIASALNSSLPYRPSLKLVLSTCVRVS